MKLNSQLIKILKMRLKIIKNDTKNSWLGSTDQTHILDHKTKITL